MKGQLWFWGAFLLFFALPFPCILYFGADGSIPHAVRSAPWLALALLATSLTPWLTLLYAFLHYLMLAPLRAIHRVRDILAHGEPRNARVEHAEQTGVHVRGFAQWKLQLSFDNLSGTPITDPLVLVDSKPHLQRFAVGKELEARISRSPGVFPNLVLAGAAPEVDVASLCRRAAAGLLGVAVVVMAYVLCWRLQNEGQGWTFLSLGHPLLVCPLVLCAYVGGLRLLGRALQMDARGEALKYRGVGVRADVLAVRQTGTYINEQPQLEFQLQFTDRDGAVHQVSVRRIVSLLDLATVPRDAVTLLYDPDDRTNVRMELP